MDEDANWWSIVVFGLLIWGAYSLFHKDKESESSYTSSSYSDTYGSREDCMEPENPYDEGSGHYAGFEWGQENEPGSCGGNSNSFIEGCEDWMSQSEEYEICLDNQ